VEELRRNKMAEEKMTKTEIEKIDKKVEEAKAKEAKTEAKVETKKVEAKPEVKTEEKKSEVKTETKKEEAKPEAKETETKETKKKAPKKVAKKEMAMANGFSLRISPKQSKFVCRVIRGKTPEAAVERLEAVISEKRPVPMAGLEIGHRKGRGLAGGRFPKNACKAIIEIIKQTGANAVVAGIESPVITIAKADRASAPFRRAGTRAKRTHIHIEVKDKTSLVKSKKANKK
jgi:ribosomal protein L22